MKLYKSLSDLGHEKNGIRLAAGFFDGVHRGHQAIIRRVIQEALVRGEAAWIMTFDIHPLKLLQPLAAPPLLTSTEHRIRLLESYGVQSCVILPFTRVMAELAPEIFILRLVQAVRNLRGMVVGRNWTFGKNGTGTPELLKKLGVRHGFAVDIVRPARWQGAIISSTRIRRAVAGGRIAEAAAMLGRPFSVAGVVGSGRGIGRRLGAPTANVTLHNVVAPANGVYAVRAVLDRKVHDGVANIGIRPTMSSGKGNIRPGGPPSSRLRLASATRRCVALWRSGERYGGAGSASGLPARNATHSVAGGRRTERSVLEVHLFDVRADLRGKDIEVFFVRKLRAERRFATRAALKARIFQDIKQAKKILTEKNTATDSTNDAEGAVKK